MSKFEIPKPLRLDGEMLQPRSIIAQVESNYARWLNGGYADKNVEIYPKIYSNTDRMRDMRVRIAQKLGVEFNNHTSDSYDGFSSIFQDWNQPTDLNMGPLRSNLAFRKQLELENEIAKEDEEILDYLLDFVFKNREARSVHLNDLSHSGPPCFIKGSEYKKMAAQKVEKHLYSFLNAFNDGQLNLLQEFDCIPAYSSGVRVQGDSVTLGKDGSPVGKVRNYPSLDTIIFNLDKEPIHPSYVVRSENGQVDNRFVGGRSRLMYAFSYPANFLLQVLNNSLMHGFKKLDPLHYSGPDDLLQRYKDKGLTNFACLDCANFGETFHPMVLKKFVEKCFEYFNSESLAEFVKTTLDAPVMINSLYKNKLLEPFITRRLGSVEEEELSLTSSFKSGHGLVAFFGKLVGVWLCLVILRKLGYNWRLVLHGKSRQVAFSNSGDDSLFGFSTLEAKEKFIRLIKDYEDRVVKPYFNVKLEKLNRFLGYIYTDSVYLLSSVCVERLVSSEKTYRFKAFHAFGHQLRYMEFLNRCLEAKTIYRVISYEFEKEYGFDLIKYMMHCESPDVTLNYSDRLILTDPAYFHYKVDPEELDPKLLQQFYHVMLPEEFPNVVEAMGLAA